MSDKFCSALIVSEERVLTRFQLELINGISCKRVVNLQCNIL
jgi:hypothetical protein